MMRPLPIEEIPRLTPEAYRQSEKYPFVVVLDNIRSRNNVGSVFRTMDAFAGTCIYLCGFTPQPPHRDIHKTALGAEQTVSWEHRTSTQELLQQLRKQGYQTIALEHTDQSRALQAFTFVPKQPYALVFGNEVKGVSHEALQHCDTALEIPQFGTKHSLNISVSVGVTLWHLVQQAYL